jgi:hypothetical protein
MVLWTPELKTNPPIKILSPVPTLPRVEMFVSSTGSSGRKNSDVLPFGSVAVAVMNSSAEVEIGKAN